MGDIGNIWGVICMITSHEKGHLIWYKDDEWKNTGNKRCKRCGRLDEEIMIDGKIVGVDACIADVVIALNNHGIKTVSCCCRHGIDDGYIMFEDGRKIIIKDL